MNAHSRWSLYIGAVVAVAVAALVVFLGLDAAGFDDPAPDRDPLATEAGVAGDPHYLYATIMPPQAEEGEFPKTVSIGSDERIPYDPAALMDRIRSVDRPYTWLVSYDYPREGAGSTVQFDWDGNVMVQRVVPWHASVFEPLLVLAGTSVQVRTDVAAPPSPTTESEPTPRVVTIRGVDITLPAGYSLSRVQAAEPRYVIRLDRVAMIVFTDYGIQDSVPITPDTPDELLTIIDSLNSIQWDTPTSSAD
jgi:hypothetical protein